MIIGIVTHFIYPHDQEIRVRKLAHSIRNAGHSVHVLCDSDNNIFELVDNDGISVHRVNLLKRILSVHRFLHNPFPANPIWYIWIFVMSLKLRIQTLIVRDLRLSLPVVIIGKLTGIRTVVDFGENFPAMHRFLGRNKLYVCMIEILEGMVIRLADSIQVVTEENRSRLVRKSPSVDKKISILSNVPSLSMFPFQRNNIPLQAFDDVEKCLKLVFVGLVDEFRGLDLVLDALTLVENAGMKYLLTIIGDGPHLPSIRDSAIKRRIDQNIIYKGWISDGKYAELLNHHIGLIPHVDCELTQTTIPNKIFDYMSVGLPVLTTYLIPVARIVNETHCGWVASHQPVAMADCLRKIALNPIELFSRGQNGYFAVTEKYNWERQIEPILRKIVSYAGRQLAP